MTIASTSLSSPRSDVVLCRRIHHSIDGQLLFRIHPKDIGVFALRPELLVHLVDVLEVGLLLELIQ